LTVRGASASPASATTAGRASGAVAGWGVPVRGLERLWLWFFRQGVGHGRAGRRAGEKVAIAHESLASSMLADFCRTQLQRTFSSTP
jgi:hypothetical protein